MMNTKNYGSDEATVQIAKPDGEKISIFDVSPTIECRWVGISSKGYKLLTVFYDTREMLNFIAHEQINGAIITNKDGWLAFAADFAGFDTWAEFVDDIRYANVGI